MTQKRIPPKTKLFFMLTLAIDLDPQRKEHTKLLAFSSQAGQECICMQ